MIKNYLDDKTTYRKTDSNCDKNKWVAQIFDKHM